MWRTLLILLLCGELASAQRQSSTAAQEVSRKEQGAHFTLSTHPVHIKAGSTRTLVIMLDDPASPKGAVIINATVDQFQNGDGRNAYLVSSQQHDGGTHLLQLRPDADLQVLSVRVPRSSMRRFSFEHEPVTVVELSHGIFEIRISALPQARVGDHLVSGEMSLLFVNDSGFSGVQRAHFEIPVTVTPGAPKGWHAEKVNPALWVVLIPLALVAGIVCFFRGEDCSC